MLLWKQGKWNVRSVPRSSRYTSLHFPEDHSSFCSMRCRSSNHLTSQPPVLQHQAIHSSWEIRDELSVHTVSRDNGDLFKAAQYIQFGQGNISCILTLQSISACNCIKRPLTLLGRPVAAPNSFPAFLNLFVPFPVSGFLSDKWSLTNTCRICLHDTYDTLRFSFWNTRSDRCIGCDRTRA